MCVADGVAAVVAAVDAVFAFVVAVGCGFGCGRCVAVGAGSGGGSAVAATVVVVGTGSATGVALCDADVVGAGLLSATENDSLPLGVTDDEGCVSGPFVRFAFAA